MKLTEAELLSLLSKAEFEYDILRAHRDDLIRSAEGELEAGASCNLKKVGEFMKEYQVVCKELDLAHEKIMDLSRQIYATRHKN